MPDIMHITHLAVATDVITSCLLDWSDDDRFFGLGTREKRLGQLFQSYRNWCESQRYDLAERAQKRLFSSAMLKPDSGKYVEISQKTLNATSARYMLFWLSSLAKQFAEWTGDDLDINPTLVYTKCFLLVAPITIRVFARSHPKVL